MEKEEKKKKRQRRDPPRLISRFSFDREKGEGEMGKLEFEFCRRSASGARFARKSVGRRFASVQPVRRNFSRFAETMESATETSVNFAWRVANIDERYVCFTRDCAVSTENV